MGSRSNIPVRIKVVLWVQSGGRCQYSGCNEILWRDALTGKTMNNSNIAHIVDVNELTHRYDPLLSPKLEKELSNLMLLCKTHHRLIDYEEEQSHSVSMLREMKQDHEARIERITGILPTKKTYVVEYAANIDGNPISIDSNETFQALGVQAYPAEPKSIDLSLVNSSGSESRNEFWSTQEFDLVEKYNCFLKSRIGNGEIKKVSLFAIAPIPLLIKLGTLLNDVSNVEVYQKHKEPNTWSWQPAHIDRFQYSIEEPETFTKSKIVGLNMSLSADIEVSRIIQTLGEGFPIWKMTIDNPCNDFLKSKFQLSMFREKYRELLSKIKVVHGKDAVIHIFPAVPVAIAVEMGRVRQSKADSPYSVYDEYQLKFNHALNIGMTE